MPNSDEPPRNSQQEEEAVSPGGIVRVAIVFEGSIVVAAYFLGELVERPPLAMIHWTVGDALWGVAAAVPMLAALVIAMRLPMAAIERLREFCRDFLAPLFSGASWTQLLILCILAGMGEEMLFRGVIQQGLADAIGGREGIVTGVAIASITFGLAHAATRAYAIVAGLVGLYLGGVLLLSGNLLVSVVAHALYDVGAFVYLFRVDRTDDKTPGAARPPNALDA
jgi:membrane protease YdiL (CAAX protease family)